MANSNLVTRTAYVDFDEKYQNIDTKIRIFENNTHIHIFVNQYPKNIKLYDDYLKRLIRPHCNKELLCICNLENQETINDISKTIINILNGK